MHETRYAYSCLDYTPCWAGLVVSVSASHTIGRGFASRPSHTKDHKNGTNCLPAWHAMHLIRVGVWLCSPTV